MTDGAGKSFIDLTANIVSAYLSNNPTPASEIPGLINQIHAALVQSLDRQARDTVGTRQAGGFREEIDDPGLFGLS